MYRDSGDCRFAPVGETEFANAIVAMGTSDGFGPTRLSAGIAGFADLRLGAEVDALLEAHLRTGELSRALPIRRSSRAAGEGARGLLLTHNSAPASQGSAASDFRSILGFCIRRSRNLTPRPFLPDTTIVLDHVGIPLGIGVYANCHGEVFADWRKNIRDLGKCSNVRVSLAAWECAPSASDSRAARRPLSEELAKARRPLVETASRRSARSDRCSRAISQ